MEIRFWNKLKLVALVAIRIIGISCYNAQQFYFSNLFFGKAEGRHNFIESIIHFAISKEYLTLSDVNLLSSI